MTQTIFTMKFVLYLTDISVLYHFLHENSNIRLLGKLDALYNKCWNVFFIYQNFR